MMFINIDQGAALPSVASNHVLLQVDPESVPLQNQPDPALIAGDGKTPDWRAE